MTADTDVDEDSGADIGHDLETERTTAPMSEYSSRAVAIGFVVMVVGVAITVGIPIGVVGF
ncbi:hypothetical protein D8Y22_10365 [Salinadaptatus halalkaliphilus]|uniref:Uncharacterized protein n=1 Tax=Salinadaptatus halalkaliphilus TaxID=2419781 RepID=A0A4S3TLG8_9EURY|nr:hypothetical protein [Salinadaptatus halalkaliphilus]THE65002.1 hypothetical protein D8Y22_10365 [Salinadaptatus halalkaliphilus]